MDGYSEDGTPGCDIDASWALSNYQTIPCRTFSLTVSLSGLTLDSLKPVEQMMCKASGLRQAQDPLV